MNNRLLDALIIVAESARRSSDFVAESRQVEEELLDKGFSEDEIDKAIRWVADRLPKKKSKPSLRVLSNFERIYMTTEGSGLLMRLRNLGLLTDEHIELIIARALLLDELPIDEESVRNMAFVLLFDLKNHRDGFSMYIDSDDNQVEN
ncbi:MAG TPA: DUF494 family protein [candidate division Zixibacteria bacterium]|nr:DUF494 family protein [candidate division Zixibacteria bacterium]